MNEPATEQIVVCAGDRVKEACARVIENFPGHPQRNSYQFVMSKWLDEDQFRRAAVLWIVDDSEPWKPVHFALCNQIPLLVPEDNIAMKQICVSASCGIFYGDAAEARACLEFLLTNDIIRQAMGANGRAYVLHHLH